MKTIITLSPNFFLSEFTRSETADRYGIENLPDQPALDNLIDLCENVLQPLREHLDTPITITSGYRSPELNTKLRGSNTSQHLLGEAADIVVHGMSNREVADYIRNNLTFDQLIYEYPDPETGDIDWIHVSYSSTYNRHEALIAEKKYHRKTYQTVYYPHTDDYFDKYDSKHLINFWRTIRTKLKDLFLTQDEWIDIKIGKKTVKLLVRSRDNDAYRIEIDRIVDLVNKDEDNQYDALSLSREAIAKYLLIDWQGLEDDNGNPLPYDLERAVELFKMNSAIFSKVCHKAEEIQLRNDSAYDDTTKK